jgi:hypothetical protein
MDELIDRLVADIGVDHAAAERAVAIIFGFLLREGPTDKVRPLLARLPGAEALLQKTDAGVAGGFADAGGIMGAGMQMMAAGLSLEQVQAVSREVLSFAREKAGADVVGQTVAAIPGLSQLI